MSIQRARRRSAPAAASATPPQAPSPPPEPRSWPPVSERDATDPGAGRRPPRRGRPGPRRRRRRARARAWPRSRTRPGSRSRSPWNVDVRIAFEVGRAALARPLRPGSTVVIVSSGAGLRRLAALRRLRRRASGCRCSWPGTSSVPPTPASSGSGSSRWPRCSSWRAPGSGRPLQSAYGAAAGRTAEAADEVAAPVPLDPDGVARAILSIASGGEHRDDNGARRDRRGAHRCRIGVRQI